ncbi:MAG: fumarylacetoacetate hydrolase family protein [Ignavibacteriales bacterium]|nr:fumarylacetoacetate hydrolase family protein [Ignavibacteriales bacterium]MCB9258649.1 fumarylacetoacetate hydrolase family protein [Ignavibacteriales bacterium]
MKKVKIKNSTKEFTVGKIVCVGRNYAEHARELGNEVPKFPIIFLKPPSTLIYDGDNIFHPSYSNEMHHEVELVLLIGKSVKNASDEEAENAIIGYGVGLDMTLRDLQNEYRKEGNPWTLAKSFDTCAVISEFVLKEEYKITGKEEIELLKNGNIQQKSSIDKMIFPPAEIVKYISERMTLEPGDLIYTGTPQGVSKVEKGDVLKSRIEHIAEIENIIE